MEMRVTGYTTEEKFEIVPFDMNRCTDFDPDYVRGMKPKYGWTVQFTKDGVDGTLTTFPWQKPRTFMIGDVKIYERDWTEPMRALARKIEDFVVECLNQKAEEYRLKCEKEAAEQVRLLEEATKAREEAFNFLASLV
jgi:hypothetical protein